MTKMNETNVEQIYPLIPLAQTIVQFCAVKNIQHIVISPGSRNAPLTKGFTSNPFFKTYSIIDERAAAFFALKYARTILRALRALQRLLPRPLCTSSMPRINLLWAQA